MRGDSVARTGRLLKVSTLLTRDQFCQCFNYCIRHCSLQCTDESCLFSISFWAISLKNPNPLLALHATLPGGVGHVAYWIGLPLTSNVTGRHRIPKRKLVASQRAPSLKWTFYLASASVYNFSSSMWYRALSLRYACIRCSGIILTPRLPLCVRFFRGLRC